jgi:hypothetical protein
MGLCSSGFAVAHGAGNGNSSAGHGTGSHSSSKGPGHHWGGWHRKRGFRGGMHRGGDSLCWSIPGYGVDFTPIPAHCKLVYWGGVPYYFADDLYYEWSATAQGFQQVQPPAGLAEQMNSQASDTQLFVFPNGNQTNEQLELDRALCHRWAAEQVGFDPNAAPHTKSSTSSVLQRAGYFHADAACLEARDYSVE